MFETIAVVGERGQITIPKSIRKMEGLNPKDYVIVKIEDHKIVVEKVSKKTSLEKLLVEGYRQTSGISNALATEMDAVSNEAERLLDDY
ncbi:MAG: AbrB/MazE/SpoVT family DNA-binding domain-containing protein [Candidatus Diapherotrites archaeon]|nr:AbrB/MazE/SpoVT family DNA-binding domain-containing protein [Candidatus Diapherotrites archaeon]